MWVYYNFYYHMVKLNNFSTMVNLIHTYVLIICLRFCTTFTHSNIYIQPNRSKRLPVSSSSLP